MTRRSRTRRVLKWSGTAICVLLATAFSATVCTSRYWSVDLPKGVSVTVCTRAVWIERTPELPPEPPVDYDTSRVFAQPPVWTVARLAQLLEAIKKPPWWPAIGFGDYGFVILPLWIPFLLFAIPTARLWWCDRRRIPPGHWRRCGYNLTGNVTGRCPECGNAVGAIAADVNLP